MLKFLFRTIWLWGCVATGVYIVSLIQPSDPPTKLLSALIVVGAWYIGGGMNELHALDGEGL